MQRIGIVGQGFVGSALREGLRHAFEIATFDRDPKLGQRVFGVDFERREPASESPLRWLVESCDGPIFVCVPTPMRPDGSCDTRIVEGVVADLSAATPAGRTAIVCVKSTVPPGTCQKLDARFANLHVCFNPEFLTERNAIDDFKNQDRIVLGGPEAGVDALEELYAVAYPHVPIIRTQSSAAEMVKYVTNCFLATKVAFANEMKLVADQIGVDYDEVIGYATLDRRLGKSHWSVPGPDGLPGFGGSCFPKDLNAFTRLAESLSVTPNVMKAAWQTNLAVRPGRDWEQLIGRAVVAEPAAAPAAC